MGNNRSIEYRVFERDLTQNEARIWNSSMKRLDYLSSEKFTCIGSHIKKEIISRNKILFFQIKQITGIEPPSIEDFFCPPLYNQESGIIEKEEEKEKIDDEIYLSYILSCVEYLNSFCSRIVD
tara:strand:+ start:74 stop:442 length:369 start_codon:yes stop_codon:yes gene_type:complete